MEPVDLHNLENTRGLGGGGGGGREGDEVSYDDHDMGGHDHGGMRCAQQ